MPNLAKYRLLFFFAVLFFVLSGTFAAIKFNQGYRIDLTSKKIKPTGLLVATSTPVGAEVFINGQLLTATDNTLSLSPGKYLVEIKKQGFLPWKKELTIEKELVTQTDAFLFPQVPDFKPLTFLEIQNPQLSPDNGKIIYTIPLPEEEAGIWVMDISDFLFNLSREPRQIAKSYPDLDFSKANFLWSPDSRQIMAELSNAVYYLLDSNQLNSNLSDYSAKVSETLKRWQNEATLRQNAKMKKIPETMQQILEQSANEINFSPDGSKILYVATASAVIPEKIIPPVMAASTQREQRTLEPNKTYVYDLKEDKNFLIPYTLLPSFTPTPAKKAVAQKKSPTPTPTLILGSHPKWFPTNRHLYWIENEKVFACDYDGTNQTIIYSGPFISPFVFAAPGANRLVILSQTNIDQNTKPNLYSVNLR